MSFQSLRRHNLNPRPAKPESLLWAETCFFARWFGEQSAAQRELVRQLVAARQLEFVGCQREPESLQIADRRAAIVSLSHSE